MKTKCILAILMINVFSVFGAPRVIPPIAESEAGKSKYEEVRRFAEAKDMQGLIRTLPELEVLWKDDPKGYLHAMSVNLWTLTRSKDPSAIKATLAALPLVVEKKCPPVTGDALFYVSAKDSMLSTYLNIDSMRANAEYYLIIADFLTEIRSKKIQDYRNQRVEITLDELLKRAGITNRKSPRTKEQVEALARIQAELKEHDDMDRLQLSIRTLELNITNSLIACAPNVDLPTAKKLEFFQELANRTKMTSEERKRLESSLK